MIEQELKRIADALEFIAGNMGSAKTTAAPVEVIPAKSKAEKKEKAPATDIFGEEEEAETKAGKEVTVDDVREAVKAYAEKHSPEKAAEILKKKFKVSKIREIAADKYAAVLVEFKL